MVLKISKLNIEEIVRQFFDRHKNSLKTYGDALNWLHNTEYEQVRQEAGKLGRSEFTHSILLLISTFGPSAKIDFEALKPKESKLVPDYVAPPEKEEKISVKKKKKRKKQ